MIEFIKAILYKPLYNLLVLLAWIIPGHSIGGSIILITIIIRGLLWKSSAAALKAPLMMRQYAGELKAIQEKYKDDRTAQGQAQMAFYKEKGINPLSGCLPLLIQLPVLLVLYRVFIAGLNQYRTDLIYPFTPHLASINSMFFGIDLAHPDKFFILPVLAAALQFAQARHMQLLNPTTQSGTDPAAMMNKQMMYLFPLMTFFIAYKLPAGLALYWTITTLFSWLQQVYVAKTFVPAKKAEVVVRSKKR